MDRPLCSKRNERKDNRGTRCGGFGTVARVRPRFALSERAGEKIDKKRRNRYWFDHRQGGCYGGRPSPLPGLPASSVAGAPGDPERA